MVPGHELSGVVTQVGSKVTKFKVGDQIGVGCFVDACLTCCMCSRGNDHMCAKVPTLTYNHKRHHGRAETYPKNSSMIGGYSNKMVIHEHFACKVPPEYPTQYVGPVMCSGVTM